MAGRHEYGTGDQRHRAAAESTIRVRDIEPTREAVRCLILRVAAHKIVRIMVDGLKCAVAKILRHDRNCRLGRRSNRACLSCPAAGPGSSRSDTPIEDERQV